MFLQLVTTCLGVFNSDPIKDYIITPLKNHISYAFTCDNNVERLHHEVEHLKNKRVRLQQSVDAATRNGEQVHESVTEWLSSAEKDIEEGEKLVQGKEEAKQKCCVGFCPNLKTRYQMSKKAHKKALAMDVQLQNAQRLDPIAFRPPAPPIIEVPSGEALQSRVLILGQIVDALKDPNLNPIVVHSMGGIGKTTLAKEVLGQAEEQKLFETVVLVAVSETPDLSRIQEGIADALVLQFLAKGVPGKARELHQRLKEAKTLILNGCRCTNVAIVAQLKQLEVLSFAGSNVKELPREIKALTRLKLLDLTRRYKLKVIPSDVLSNLSLLQELYVFGRYDGWGTEGNASLLELKSLSRLKTLEIRVKDDKLLPENWFFNGIKNYKISIGERHWSDTEETSRMLMLELKTNIGLMDRIKEFMGGAEVLYLHEVNGIESLSCDSSMENVNSFQRLRVLKIENCNSLREVLPFSSEKCLPRLQEMEVRFCSNIEAIVGEGNENEVMEFPKLTSLKLRDLPICRISRGMVCFPNLTSLEIYKCHSLKYVFTTSMVKSLKQLKELYISECESMEEIILVTKCKEVVVFPELDFLRLVNLPNLKRLSSGYLIKFPKLRELKIECCYNNESRDEYFFNELVTLPNLEIMHIEQMGNLRYLWHQQFADKVSFSKLKSLEIRHCEKLSAVFPSNAYRRFERLESLDVCECNAVEEIYEYEGVGYEQTNVLQAFSLQRVCLKSLQSLKHIWSKDIDEAFSFENLQSVEVKSCPELKYLIPVSIACGLQQLQHLKIKNCGVEMIIAEPKNEGSEGASIRTFEWPKLKSLRIRDCDKLIKFGSIISKAKHNIATQDLVYFIQKIIPNVKVLNLSHHSLKAIQSDDHRLPEDQLL